MPHTEYRTIDIDGRCLVTARSSQRSPSCWPGGARGPASRLPDVPLLETCGKFWTDS